MEDNITSTQSGDEVETSAKDALLNAFMDGPETENDEDALVIETDEPEAEIEADGEDADKQADDVDPVHRVKVDGVEIEIKQSELLKDASKYRSADGKFREAAEIRKAHETALQEVSKDRDLLTQALAKYNDILSKQLQAEEPDWQDLLDNNPAEFQRQKYAFDMKQRDLKTTADIQSYLNQQRDAENQKRHDDFVAVETQKLFDAIPAWKDKTKAVAESAAVSKYLDDLGFNAEAQSSIIDHRLILISRKAMLYDQAIAKSKQTATGAAKPVTRNERPQTVKTQTPSNKASAEKAFKANPSKDTLSAFFM